MHISRVELVSLYDNAKLCVIHYGEQYEYEITSAGVVTSNTRILAEVRS
jgi:hypothetical protein